MLQRLFGINPARKLTPEQREIEKLEEEIISRQIHKKRLEENYEEALKEETDLDLGGCVYHEIGIKEYQAETAEIQKELDSKKAEQAERSQENAPK